jgi:hypothetical protein
MEKAIFFENKGEEDVRGGISFLYTNKKSLENKELWIGGGDSYQKLVVPFPLSHNKVKREIRNREDKEDKEDVPVIGNEHFDKLFNSCSFEINNKGKRKTLKTASK